MARTKKIMAAINKRNPEIGAETVDITICKGVLGED